MDMNTTVDLSFWERKFAARMQANEMDTTYDPAHDMLHLKRVVKTAKQLARSENARLEVVVPAAWLHDFIVVPKNDPRRAQASRISAEAAVQFLAEIGYPGEYFPAIAHAIEAHSFSANIRAETVEARVVQDADRLDGLGAIGVARCFATAGLLKRPFYSEEDPFCLERPPADRTYTVDHFYQKLFRVAESLQTTSAQAEGRKRALAMKAFLENLAEEIS